MHIVKLFVLAISLLVTLPAFAKSEGNCYVSGDTSKSNLKKPYGSRQNPYGSLADVEADLSCKTINVLHSEIPLDGGVALKDGQNLIGRKGPRGNLPKITNTIVLSNAGSGVVLGKNNRIKRVHITDTATGGIVGGLFAPVGGEISIENVLITGINQSGSVIPELSNGSWSGVTVAGFEDISLTVKNSEISGFDSVGILVRQAGGSGEYQIHNTTVRDLGVLDASAFKQGILITARETGNVRFGLLNSAVSNIGEGNSNSDGIAALNLGVGRMDVDIDGYTYVNPDGDGGPSATGLEMGLFRSIGGGSFSGRVVNSSLTGSTAPGIQVLDYISFGGSNSLRAEMHNNRIEDCDSGIQLVLGDSSFSSAFFDISSNTITEQRRVGLELVAFNLFGSDPLQTVEIKLEENRIEDSQSIGLIFAILDSTSINSYQFDAGLGGLGSEGRNSIVGSREIDIFSLAANVSAANNWWGSASGPASVVELNGATVDVEPYLVADPN